MIEYDKNDLESAIYEEIPETLGNSYSPVDREAIEYLEANFQQMDIDEFVGGNARFDSGVVFYDPDNEKAAYMSIKPHSEEVVLVDTRHFGDEEGVIANLLEEPEETITLEDAVNGPGDTSLGTGPDYRGQGFSPRDDSRGQTSYRNVDTIV